MLNYGFFSVVGFSGRRTFASTSARGADITLTVDGKEVTVPQGFFGFIP